LKCIFEVDLLRCLRCAEEMCIVAFILDPDVTAALHCHRHRKECDPRALPEHAAQDPPGAPP